MSPKEKQLVDITNLDDICNSKKKAEIEEPHQMATAGIGGKLQLDHGRFETLEYNLFVVVLVSC